MSWSSVTLLRSWPDRANMISRFSISVARDSFTRRMRPSRSAASGSRICASKEARASAGFLRCQCQRNPHIREHKNPYIPAVYISGQLPPLTCQGDRLFTSADHPAPTLSSYHLHRGAAGVGPDALCESMNRLRWSTALHIQNRLTSSKSASDIF